MTDSETPEPTPELRAAQVERLKAEIEVSAAKEMLVMLGVSLRNAICEQPRNEFWISELCQKMLPYMAMLDQVNAKRQAAADRLEKLQSRDKPAE